ncbi:Uma2 family endonuclease [Streptomyces sp. NPDC048290]|uniref:Uma2 family endonuclease n=1 Tax=Streptomyces sp. NPDC048290 TaxID=3155811 RepID=UPI00341972AE
MGETLSAEPGDSVRWPRPPERGYTVDDLLTLDSLPPRTQLMDGSLVFVSPQRYYHFSVIDLLMSGLRRTLPTELTLAREMPLRLDDGNAPLPDVMVLRAGALTSLDQDCFEARDALLAVEVVTPESASRDGTTKPLKYAAAGVPHYWRVERDMGTDQPVVHVYERVPLTGAYRHMGLRRERIRVAEPFDVDFELALARP